MSIIIILVVQVTLHLAIISCVDGATVFGTCISTTSVSEIGTENQNVSFFKVFMLVVISRKFIEILTVLQFTRSPFVALHPIRLNASILSKRNRHQVASFYNIQTTICRGHLVNCN